MLYFIGGNRISIHAPLRGRPAVVERFRHQSQFQSTPPCGGDRDYRAWTKAIHDFNPRPLAGATNGYMGLVLYNKISIHAPLRGRRPLFGVGAGRVRISIHAPLRGRPIFDVAQKFNSFISIHAPLLRAIQAVSDFNPRPLAGATCLRLSYNPMDRHFNPRPLAGATTC